ncbi:nitrate- and nitrite sensing domain-containing protein [Actinomadura sp. HBU206391]|uniref:sensor histidine kinase n=1 Tax=Actinomadura sp. HBU206391 TaxID=2731692 RepID=UPI0016505144|nr:nitrate- and nitrite sensing domain-containing protein [Actinomadura sp. HBU206391]MBC6458322.1 nitrate- and nitrite sensing domain-containing protein [Actinomadura sp. HBU206391]
MQLTHAKTLDEKLLRPTQSLIESMQRERRLSIAFLAGDATVTHAAFGGPRAQTDRARSAFRRSVADSDLRDVIEADTTTRADGLVSGLGAIDALRRSIDSRTVDRQRVLDEFSALVDGALGMYARVDPKDGRIARDGRTLTTWGMVQELLSREDALLTGALTVGRYTAGEREQFARLVAQQRYTFAASEPYLQAGDLSRYKAFNSSPEVIRFRALEDRMIHEGTRPSLDARAWHAEAGQVTTKLWGLGMAAVEDLTNRAEGYAVVVLLRLGLTGGLGFIAIVVSLVVSFRVGRRLVREFRGLARAVNHFSDKRLPEVAERARRGEDVDPDFEAPDFSFAISEAEELNDAFVKSRRAVVGATVNEAAVHRAVSEVFVNLARRNQVLLQRQLKLLDAMERRSDDPAELADLFKLDHLSTRMRRHAEGLVILSGKPAGRAWRKPVPMVDVLRGAAAEVEDYPRVKVLAIESAALAGTAVTDTIHLLAELIENATLYSPPATPVQVSGHRVAKGFVVEIEDRGLGLDSETRDQLNERLADPPEFDLSESARLGLLVVGRLAERHDIQVTLRASPYGGTMAIVLIPAAVIEDLPGPEAAAPSDPATDPVTDPVTERAMARAMDSASGPASGRDPRPASDARRGAGGNAVADAVADASRSQGGEGELPRRRRQASLAPRLREEPSAPAPAAESEPGAGSGTDNDRPPEALRSRMAAMQRGWQRGRIDAHRAETPAGPSPRSGTEENG